MTSEGTQERGVTRRRKIIWWAGVLLLAGLVVPVGYRMYYPYPAGPAQPIPFSHAVHAGERGINCLFCHSTADRSSNAGLPPTATCVLCHQRIITQFPQVKEELDEYAQGRPIAWVRVYRLPDHVRFTHAQHVTGVVDCGSCHGNVKAMDRVIQALPLQMGTCVTCHRTENARVGCTVCHY